MKIAIEIDEKYSDTEIRVGCRRLTPELEKMIAMLRMLEMQLTVEKDGVTYLLDVDKVLYVEAVERKTFVYTDEQVYESGLKLYELEQQLEDCGFFRASKSCLIYLKHIESLKADINRRIRVTMKNGEQIVVSRMYAEELRRRLGLK
ncbi:MAG: LytTR family DNA-binding domain-containing protein [Acetatifactor sp.]|nr:LytTR family DNA-binding domain-containing protein [Acetatifactor sp.]